MCSTLTKSVDEMFSCYCNVLLLVIKKKKIKTNIAQIEEIVREKRNYDVNTVYKLEPINLFLLIWFSIPAICLWHLIYVLISLKTFKLYPPQYLIFTAKELA